MAVTALSISQDNIVGSVDLLATHNPLIFIAELTESAGEHPESIDVDIEIDSTSVGSYKALFYEEKTSTIARYIFIADGILRSLLDDFSDFSQGNNTIDNVLYFHKTITITFSYGGFDDAVTINAAHIAKNYGSVAAASDVWNNTYTQSYLFANRYGYIHFWNSANASASINMGGITTTVSGELVQGLKRQKRIYTTVGVKEFNIEVDGSRAASYEIIVKPNCESGLYVKWLDSATGMYRFWLFNQFYESAEQYENIGTVIKNQLTLSTQAFEELGQRVKGRISAIADGLTTDELTYLASLGGSPRIYIELNSVWEQVKLVDGEVPTKYRKANAGSMAVGFERYANNTITML